MDAEPWWTSMKRDVMSVRLWCLPLLAGHLDWAVAMSTMQERSRSGPVLPPGRSRGSFPREFKAGTVAAKAALRCLARRWSALTYAFSAVSTA